MNKTKLLSVGAVSSVYESIFGSVGEAADVDGKVLAQLRYIGEAVDGLEGAVNIPDVEYKSPRDFSATYTSSSTITLSGLPDTFNSEDIAYILCIPPGGSGAFLLLNGHNGITITISSNVITVNGSENDFASGDVYLVGLNGQKKGYDPSTNSDMTSSLNPAYANYTSPEHIDEDNEGAQNDIKYTRHVFTMDNYKHISFSYLITADDTHNDVTLKVYGTNKDDYILPDEDTAIADSDMIFNLSADILGNAAGVTVNNASSGDLVFVETATKPYALIFELKYEEDNTAAPANAADLYVIKYY